MPALRFIPNDADEGEGLSDAGIETYRDNPFPALARETAQNSRDAHDMLRCPEDPVRVEIDRIEVPPTELPGIEDYSRIVRLCHETARTKGNKKEIDFFRQAEAVLSARRVPILRIADYNTFGLKGPCREGYPFHALVKSSGVSDKPDDTSGGSFGIGKSAVYSASDLQTAFYSTVYRDGSGRDSFLCQGKTKFRSFVDEGRAYRGVGYWGEPRGFLPVADPSLVPDWLRRDSIGTTVCSIGVRDTSAWEHQIIASLVANFFSAIASRKMEFLVQNVLVSTHTLAGHLHDPSIAAAADEEFFSFARAMHRCLVDPHETERRDIVIPEVGSFKLHVLAQDGMPKRVGILRNGMYICDSLKHFGDTFSRFPLYRDFVAVLEPADESSNSWLRAMENPKHDELSPERLLDPRQRSKAKRNGKLLAQCAREEIASIAKTEKEDQTDLEELSEFFAIDHQRRPDEGGVPDIRTIRVRPPIARPRIRRTRSPVEEGNGEAGGGVRGTTDGKGTGGGGRGSGEGDGSAGVGHKSLRRSFPLESPRTIAVRDEPRSRRIVFTPLESGHARLRFESSGVSDPAVLELDGGECLVECIAGQRKEILVRFIEPYDGPIEIISWREEAAHEAK